MRRRRVGVEAIGLGEGAVRVFTIQAHTLSGLDAEVNNWLANNEALEVLDISVGGAGGDSINGGVVYFAMITVRKARGMA